MQVCSDDFCNVHASLRGVTAAGGCWGLAPRAEEHCSPHLALHEA